MPVPARSGAGPSVTWARGPVTTCGLRRFKDMWSGPAAPNQSTRPAGVDRKNSDGRGLFVLDQVAGLVRVDRDTRAHGGGDGGLLDVTALRRGRLEPGDLVHGGCVVLQQRLGRERGLADHEVQVALPVGA